MRTTHTRRYALAFFCAALTALTFVGADATAVDTGVASAASGSGGGPIVKIDGGAVRGVAVPGGYAFRGLPYAAAPTGHLRWRAPRSPADWKGIRDATDFAPSCPQPATNNPFLPPGAIEEDCLYLNVSTPDLRSRGDGRPVLVWIHGGGLTQDAGRNYDSSKARVGRRGRRHDQLPAGRARLPCASRASPRGGIVRRQLRADGPAGGTALGEGQHPWVRRRPATT